MYLLLFGKNVWRSVVFAIFRPAFSHFITIHSEHVSTSSVSTNRRKIETNAQSEDNWRNNFDKDEWDSENNIPLATLIKKGIHYD